MLRLIEYQADVVGAQDLRGGLCRVCAVLLWRITRE
jgi:hypothetical protein